MSCASVVSEERWEKGERSAESVESEKDQAPWRCAQSSAKVTCISRPNPNQKQRVWCQGERLYRTGTWPPVNGCNRSGGAKRWTAAQDGAKQRSAGPICPLKPSRPLRARRVLMLLGCFWLAAWFSVAFRSPGPLHFVTRRTRRLCSATGPHAAACISLSRARIAKAEGDIAVSLKLSDRMRLVGHAASVCSRVAREKRGSCARSGGGRGQCGDFRRIEIWRRDPYTTFQPEHNHSCGADGISRYLRAGNQLHVAFTR